MNRSTLYVLFFATMVAACERPQPTRPAEAIKQTAVEAAPALLPPATCDGDIGSEACVACAKEVLACSEGNGIDACAKDCNACLGERFCVLAIDNLSEVVNRSDERSPALLPPAPKHAIWAFQQTFTGGVSSNGRVYLARDEDRQALVFDGSGRALWKLWDSGIEEPERQCGIPFFVSNTIQRACEGFIEVYDDQVGLKLGQFPTEEDLREVRKPLTVHGFEASPSGQTAYVPPRILSLNGTIVELEAKPDAFAVRTGEEWTQYAYVADGRVDFFEGSAKTKSVPFGLKDPEAKAVANAAVLVAYGKDGYRVMRLEERKFGPIQPPSPLREPLVPPGNQPLVYAKYGNQLQTLYPEVGPELRHFEYPTTDISENGKARAHSMTTARFIDGKLEGTIADSVIRARIESETSFSPLSDYHGHPLWAVHVPNTHQVWVASNEGLVKRWDMSTGASIIADVPYTFAIGMGRVGPNGELILTERRFQKKDVLPAKRVLIWHENKDPKIINLDAPIFVATMPRENELVVSTEDGIKWVDIATGKVTKSAGSGFLSQDGSSVFEGSRIKRVGDVLPPDGFVYRSNGGPKTKVAATSGCAFSPNGVWVLCREEAKGPDDFKTVLRNLETGDSTAVENSLAPPLDLTNDGRNMRINTSRSPSTRADFVETVNGGRVKSWNAGHPFLGFTDDNRLIGYAPPFLWLEPVED